ncbi:hypothetical protein H310_12996 [Aphanomyces invadans]|uniref:Calcineurin-like phosphoesterase domain-containing protein n=1 Tax=Aphanomyces invadans TaxID=157072 RepID=A0A024THD7_9STRA|nr:hypothetical protein H310_12996 [Aphanomyces invadans]ETV92767.1 hypothetical protein H310_12996 [Aphanomyces invadans]|eukprot:XP_008878537.1 hypothetical protein H310_12996 [Aphanomyces invadans]
MRVTLPLVAVVALATPRATTAFNASSLPVDVNDVFNWLGGEIHKLELPVLNEYIDTTVQAALRETAKIDRPPLMARTTSAGGAAFTILQIPDLHYSGNDDTACLDKPASMKAPCQQRYMAIMVGALLDAVHPDFVVFTGDQIEGQYAPQTWGDSYRTVDKYAAEATKRNIPWAMVFGNHDESIAPKLLMAYIESLPLSYAKYGPMTIGGVGNYELTVQTRATHNASALRLYFIDTHKDGNVTTDQLTYIKSLAAAHQVQYDVVPALMFFHIPTPEYKSGPVLQGERNEGWVPPAQHGLFDAMVQMGDVKASFCGHNHLDDFCTKKSNISLCISGTSGYGWAYGKSTMSRTARVIEWTKNATTETISTWLYFHQSASVSEKLVVYAATN